MFPRGGAANASLARPITAGTNFKTQVQALMDTLLKSQPHYIRCIKPNELKKAGVFTDDLCMHQVRYLGLLENVRVRRAGFAFRQTFERFLARYKMLSQATWPTSNNLSAQEGCKQIMSALSIAEGQQYQMGKTKVRDKIRSSGSMVSTLSLLTLLVCLSFPCRSSFVNRFRCSLWKSCVSASCTCWLR